MIDWQIKLRDLQCFLEVARQRSVVKADDALSATQATVFKIIRELEYILTFSSSARLPKMSNEGCVRGRHAVLRRGARARRPAIGGAGDYACASAAALGVNLKAGQFRRPDDQFATANTATQHNFPPMMS